MTKRRKLYLRDPSQSVPRQTLWSATAHQTRGGGGVLDPDSDSHPRYLDPNPPEEDLEDDDHDLNPLEEDSEDDDHDPNPPEGDSEDDDHDPHPLEEDSDDDNHDPHPLEEDSEDDDHDPHPFEEDHSDLESDDLGGGLDSLLQGSDPDTGDISGTSYILLTNLGVWLIDSNSLNHAGVSSYLTQPLYAGAPLSCEASMYLTYQYAIKAKLSYQMTTHLINLIRVHCPAENLCPSSLHTLKKHFSNKRTPNVKRYCSGCLDEIPSVVKQCQKRGCKRCDPCYFCVLPFEEHISEMYSG